jgi:hypothetical protein
MLNEIRLFFEGLRKPFSWPTNNLSAVDPFMDRELRAESQKHWRFAMQELDKIEFRLIKLHEASNPAAMDVLDQAMSIIRQEDESRDDRLRRLAQLKLSVPRR